MEREEIYQELRELIPDLKRRIATPRVLAPVDVLLDQLCEIQFMEFEQGFSDGI